MGASFRRSSILPCSRVPSRGARSQSSRRRSVSVRLPRAACWPPPTSAAADGAWRGMGPDTVDVGPATRSRRSTVEAVRERALYAPEPDMFVDPGVRRGDGAGPQCWRGQGGGAGASGFSASPSSGSACPTQTIPVPLRRAQGSRATRTAPPQLERETRGLRRSVDGPPRDVYGLRKRPYQ